MARYIAIPHGQMRDVEVESLILPFDDASRAEVIERNINDRRGDGRLAPTPSLDSYFADKDGAAIIADPRGQTPLTGVTIIEGDAGDASVLQQELPDHEVFEDFVIRMVEPVEALEAARDTPEPWHLTAIGLIDARSRGFRGQGEGKVIAILDTGVAMVPELGARIAGAWEVSGTMQTSEIATHDTDGHGTGVASLAIGKTIGIAPAAQVLNVLMMPFRRAMYLDFLTAMEFTARRPNVSVANISAGLEGRDLRMLPGINALLQAGILPVVAVGNDGEETSRSPGNLSEVLSVGASTRDDRVWKGSGNESISDGENTFAVPNVVAPGEDVTTIDRNGTFRSWSGSSLAAPIVSGLAALITEKHGAMKLADLRAEIIDACEPISGASPARQGNGLVRIPTVLWFAGS